MAKLDEYSRKYSLMNASPAVAATHGINLVKMRKNSRENRVNFADFELDNRLGNWYNMCIKINKPHIYSNAQQEATHE